MNNVTKASLSSRYASKEMLYLLLGYEVLHLASAVAVAG